MFTLSFVSSLLGLAKLLRSYLKPKELHKKVHVNVPLSQALRGQSQVLKGLCKAMGGLSSAFGDQSKAFGGLNHALGGLGQTFGGLT